MNVRTTLGRVFAAEIAEQPAIWRALAASPAACLVRDAIGSNPILLIGSGSSFFVAQLAARVLRRSGRAAFALAATDVPSDRAPFVPATVVALSQSGRSADVLAALDCFPAARCVAITNDVASPLAVRAHVAVAVAAGDERAVPATKSVTAMAAIMALAAADDADGARVSLRAAAVAVEAWLAGRARDETAGVVARLAGATNIIVAGSGDSIPIAREIALKCKEATYRHAEGVAAGEFRHGGVAMLDARCALLLLAPDDPAQRKLSSAAQRAGATVLAFAGPDGIGPAVPAAWSALGLLVAGQQLALELGRASGIDGDAPRGITKVVG